MVEEVLRHTMFEDFVKSYREGSKVTFVRGGGNRFGRFLEVTVYAVGGRRGMTLFPKGRDGWGWSCVFGELSKALAFLEATIEARSSGVAPVGEFLGKAAGPLSFVEAVRSLSTVLALGGRPLVPSAEVEKILPLGLEQVTVWAGGGLFRLGEDSFGSFG